MLRYAQGALYLYSQHGLLSLIHSKSGIKLRALLKIVVASTPFLVAVRSQNNDGFEHYIIEHLEQGIALLDSSLRIVFSNHRFDRLFHICFGKDGNNVLSDYINGLGSKKRAVIRIERNPNTQFFMVIKTFMVASNEVYLLTLNKRRMRKIDLFKVLQAEYEISLNDFNILTYLGKGFNNNEIAQLCKMKTCNVKYHLSRLYDKFYVSNRTEFLNKVKEIENGVF